MKCKDIYISLTLGSCGTLRTRIRLVLDHFSTTTSQLNHIKFRYNLTVGVLGVIQNGIITVYYKKNTRTFIYFISVDNKSI